MLKIVTRKAAAATLLTAAFALSACSTEQVIDNSAGAAAGATKVVAKGVVGAGKLAYKGGKSLIASDE